MDLWEKGTRTTTGADDLHGGSGLDWYFAHLCGKKKDDLDGRKAGEIVTAI
jgi:hypothetical protein